LFYPFDFSKSDVVIRDKIKLNGQWPASENRWWQDFSRYSEEERVVADSRSADANATAKMTVRVTRSAYAGGVATAVAKTPIRIGMMKYFAFMSVLHPLRSLILFNTKIRSISSANCPTDSTGPIFIHGGAPKRGMDV